MKNKRLPFFDNAKAVLIFLVVLGHLTINYLDLYNMRFLYFFIYTFHMPLFIFISGIFAKKTINSATFNVKKIFTLILLYILFKIVLFLLSKYGFHYESSLSLFQEAGVPWYLLATAIWITATYLLKTVKRELLLPAAFLVGILIGYESVVGDYLVLSRVFTFSPFFLLGYYTDPEKLIQVLTEKSNKTLAIFFLLFVGISIYFLTQDNYFLVHFFEGRQSYISIGQHMFGGLYRLAAYVTSLFMSLAILTLIPKKQTFFTHIGRVTSQIYIIHYPLISIYNYLQLNHLLFSVFSSVDLVFYLALSMPLTFLLAWRPKFSFGKKRKWLQYLRNWT